MVHNRPAESAVMPVERHMAKHASTTAAHSQAKILSPEHIQKIANSNRKCTSRERGRNRIGANRTATKKHIPRYSTLNPASQTLPEPTPHTLKLTFPPSTRNQKPEPDPEPQTDVNRNDNRVMVMVKRKTR